MYIVQDNMKDEVKEKANTIFWVYLTVEEEGTTEVHEVIWAEPKLQLL
jgi:hypothetical protein